MKTVPPVANCLLLLCCSTAAAEGFLEQSDLFVSGTEGYRTFRIPVLVVSKPGTVRAFCGSRKESR